MARRLAEHHGIAATGQKDRTYFRSIYFRKPGGIRGRLLPCARVRLLRGVQERPLRPRRRGGGAAKCGLRATASGARSRARNRAQLGGLGGALRPSSLRATGSAGAPTGFMNSMIAPRSPRCLRRVRLVGGAAGNLSRAGAVQVCRRRPGLPRRVAGEPCEPNFSAPAMGRFLLASPEPP
jgi:hypothetical protein